MYKIQLLKKFITIFIIANFGVESVFAYTPKTSSRSIASIDTKLQKQLDEFQALVMGQEIECSAKSKEEFKYVYEANTVKSSTAQLNDLISAEINTPLDPLFVSYENQTIAEDSCKVTKIPGLFDNTIFKILDAEKNGIEDKLEFKEIFSILNQAQILKEKVQATISANGVDSLKLQLLTTYYSQVIIPIRNILTIISNYQKNLDQEKVIQSFYINFPTSIIPQDESEETGIMRAKIVLGPNPMVDPYNLKIIETSNNNSSLMFDQETVLARDLIILAKAPSKKNYLSALKLHTIQMIISQIHFSDIILGHEDAKIKIPNSCQKDFKIGLPSTISFKKNNDLTNEIIIENILVQNGLTSNYLNNDYAQYALENIDKDPTHDNFAATTPFEQYRFAKFAIENGVDQFLGPAIDDQTNFEQVINLKSGQISEVLQNQAQIDQKEFGVRSHRYQVFDIANTIKEILQVPNPERPIIIRNQGEDIEIDPTVQNLSTALSKKMQASGALHYEELISEALKKELQQNIIKIDFPALYSNDVWRNWSILLLKEAINKSLNDKKFDLPNKLSQICTLTKTAPICSLDKENSSWFLSLFKNPTPQELVLNLQKALSSIDKQSTLLPLLRDNSTDLNKNYPLLAFLWKSLRDNTNYLPSAITNEYSFLLDQMSALNPWARLRLSYLIKRDELKFQARNKEINLDSKILRDYIDGRLKFLDQALAPLKITSPLQPFMGDKILSYDEKMYLFENIVSNKNEQNSNLFSIELENKTAYEHIQNIAFQTFLDQKRASDELNKLSGIRTQKNQQAIDEVASSDTAKQSTFLLDIYKQKNNLKKQQEILKDLLLQFPDLLATDVKHNLFSLDQDYKKALYTNVIQNAAYKRRTALNQELQKLCSLKVNDHQSFKKMFYATSIAQNKILELAGLPQVPQAVLDQVNSLSPEEWTDIKLGLGQMALLVSTSLTAGACTLVSGGMCLPVSAALFASAIGTTALQVTMFERELKRKLSHDGDHQDILELTKLGLASSESAYEMERSWFWTNFEALNTLPLVGVISRGVGVSGKLAIESGKAVIKGTSKTAFKEIAKQAIAEADVKLAKHVLGFDSLYNKFKISNRVSRPIKNLQLFYKGEIGLSELTKSFSKFFSANFKLLAKEMLSPVAIRAPLASIDKHTVEVLDRYFAKNQHTLLNLLKSYSGTKMENAIKTMNQINNQQGFIANIPLIGSIYNGIRKLRVEHLAKNEQRISKLISNLAKNIASKESLEVYLKNNLDDLTEFFINVPMRKRELPFVVLLQGGPHLGGPLFGARLPVVGDLADGIILRKFFNARARLVYESYKNMAHAKLGLSTLVSAKSSSFYLKSFDQSLKAATTKTSTNSSADLLRKYNQFQDDFATKLYKYFTSTTDTPYIKNMSFQNFKTLIFAPKDLAEEAFVDTLLKHAPIQEFLNTKTVNELAHNVAKELSNYKNIDEFENFLSALKMLLINNGEISTVELM